MRDEIEKGMHKFGKKMEQGVPKPGEVPKNALMKLVKIFFDVT
jgi:hypothetical protein